MTIKVNLPVLDHKLADRALHIDFVRLRCGSERKFAQGIQAVRDQTEIDDVHPFIAFSEWDALLVVPCSRLYPQVLTDIYANPDVAESVSGTSGYFAYLWENDVNRIWPETLTHMEGGGPSILVSLRFADWFREDIGLGAEILFCNRVRDLLKPLDGIRAVVAHSLGWNDVILLLNASGDEARLIDLVRNLRMTTLGDCLGSRREEQLGFSQGGETQIFAASYSHLLGGFQHYVERRLSFGSLSAEIKSARLLARVAPQHEQGVEEFLKQHAVSVGADAPESEMGHYSLSIDMSEIAKVDGSRKAIRFIADTRAHIGSLTEGVPNSYAETTSIFRLGEQGLEKKRAFAPLTPTLQDDIRDVQELLTTVPQLLRELGASSMTSHRFVSVLNTLLDHLFDPVRSSVVRHLSRFAKSLPRRIRGLSLDGVDDLCHVLEYAVGQATDGISQFQHDANALGLSGRGGYSRLIAAAEWYIRSTFIGLNIHTELPLITFGLRSGNAGSTGHYQIDIPFNVLFVPSRWHIIFHEIGHLAWLHTFGWMMESLFIYRSMEREIKTEIMRKLGKRLKATPAAKISQEAGERVHVEFLRVREIVKELFPSYLMFALPCAGSIEEFDALALRPMIKAGHESSLSRELLMRVVTHCLLEIMQDALEEKPTRQTSGAANVSPTDSYDSTRRKHQQRIWGNRAAEWWGTWKTLRNRPLTHEVDKAIKSIYDTVKRVAEEFREGAARRETRRDAESRRPARLEPIVSASLHMLGTDTFRASVEEALESVVMVLSLRGDHFLDEGSNAPAFFGRLLERIDEAKRPETDLVYQAMLGKPFSEWIHEGIVLTAHRESFDWSRLLLGSRSELLLGDSGEFLRSQLSVLLSMWHDAITETHKDYEDLERILIDLGVVRIMEMKLPSGATPVGPVQVPGTSSSKRASQRRPSRSIKRRPAK